MSIYEFVGERDGRTVLKLTSPVDLETSKELICANAEDVAAAIKKAREAQPAWAALSIRQRAAYMDAALKVMIEDTEQIMQTIISETGKVPTEAMMEVWAICDSLAYYSKNAEKFLAPEKRKVHGFLGFMKKVRLVYQPLGVAAVISPWNCR